jgi:CheY-like chemotaxis protein
VASTRAELSVLYVEDNESNLLLVKRLFRDRGDLALRTASRGLEGITIARAELPGLILLDLNLPDMSGTEVLDALQAEPATAAIPVVIVSADATPEQGENLRMRGAADYVTKPFEVRHLMAVIDAHARPTVLDRALVDSLLELDADGSTFRALAEAAMSEAALQVSAIATAASDDDGAVQVAAAAHGLKASAAIVGAVRLAGLADAVQAAARVGRVPDPMLIAELRSALTAAEQALGLIGRGDR